MILLVFHEKKEEEKENESMNYHIIHMVHNSIILPFIALCCSSAMTKSFWGHLEIVMFIKDTKVDKVEMNLSIWNSHSLQIVENVGRVDVSMSRTMGKCNMYHVYSTIFGYFLGILRVRSHRLPCFYWSISPCLYILSITIKIRP